MSRGNRETTRARQRRWRERHRQRLSDKERARRAARTDIDRHKRNAQSVVHRAIKSGKLVRPTVCSINDESCTTRIEAHHEDYSKPLEVTWLCTSHHQRLHPHPG